MKTVFLIAACCLSLSALAQDSTRLQMPRFFSATQAGLLEGEAGSSFLVQTVNGLSFKNWSAGVGAGIDKYADRSIPLFLHLQRKVLPQKKLPLYFYADGGVNIPWPQGDWKSAWTNRKYQLGLYADGGVQYQWAFRKKGSFLFSLGYSEKRYSWEEQVQSFCIDGSCPDRINKFWFTNRLIALKAGIRL